MDAKQSDLKIKNNLALKKIFKEWTKRYIKKYRGNFLHIEGLERAQNYYNSKIRAYYKNNTDLAVSIFNDIQNKKSMLESSSEYRAFLLKGLYQFYMSCTPKAAKIFWNNQVALDYDPQGDGQLTKMMDEVDSLLKTSKLNVKSANSKTDLDKKSRALFISAFCYRIQTYIENNENKYFSKDGVERARHLARYFKEKEKKYSKYLSQENNFYFSKEAIRKYKNLLDGAWIGEGLGSSKELKKMMTQSMAALLKGDEVAADDIEYPVALKIVKEYFSSS